MKKGVFILVILILTALATSNFFAQGRLGKVGKLFTQTEAKILFGKVIGSVELDVEDLKNSLNNVTNYILFTIKSNIPIVADEKNNILSKVKVFLDLAEIKFLFSKDVVNEFLSKVKTKTIKVERRATVLSLSSSDLVLEGAFPCPPVCSN